METSGALRLVVRRRLDRSAAAPTDRESTLTGTWSGLESPVVLAYVD
jgi:hypothetical protein